MALLPSWMPHNARRRTMIRTALASAMTAAALLSLPGCAVLRDQSTAGQYMDDTAITTAVKARFIDNKDVDASSISVETLNGTVLLSGFAKDASERSMAETLTRNVKGVKSVRNEIKVRN
jgi:hyperosmotically inducible protein